MSNADSDVWTRLLGYVQRHPWQLAATGAVLCGSVLASGIAPDVGWRAAVIGAAIFGAVFFFVIGSWGAYVQRRTTRGSRRRLSSWAQHNPGKYTAAATVALSIGVFVFNLVMGRPVEEAALLALAMGAIFLSIRLTASFLKRRKSANRRRRRTQK